MDMSSIRAVVFDLDGTLLDTYDVLVASFDYAVRDVFGHDVSREKFTSTIGRPLPDQMALYSDDSAVVDALVASYRTFNLAHTIDMTKIYPGIADLVQSLHDAGVPIVIATSKVQKTARDGLAAFGLDNLFLDIIGADSCVNHKPDPEPLLRAADAINTDPHVCIYIGDSPFDMQAARAAGMCAVGATWGYHAASALTDAGAEHLCETPQDFADYIAPVKAYWERQK